MSDAAIANYVETLTTGPVVSFGIALPGVPSVTIAWDEAIASLMAHMTSDPCRRRFAYIRGFPRDPHSMRREAGFRLGLQRAGRAFDDQLLLQGNYSVADAFNAVTRLVDAGLGADAIVAANDDMAIGAMAALASRGQTVPDDVIVAGFDDSVASFTSKPALTSVRLDTERLAEATADVLLGAIAAGQPLGNDFRKEIASGLVIRASTGGPEVKPNVSAIDPRARMLATWEPERAPEPFDAVGLADSVLQTMRTGDDSFATARRRITESDIGAFAEGDVIWLRHMVDQIRAALTNPAERVASDSGLRKMVEQLAIFDAELVPVEMMNRTAKDVHRELQERLVMHIASCSDRASLWATLSSGLRSLGMTNAWVALNDPEGQPKSTDSAECVGSAGRQDGDRMRLIFSLADGPSDATETFQRSSILPDRFGAILEQDVFAVVPLRAGTSNIGHIVLEPLGEHLLELESLASGVAQILRHVDHVDDLEFQAARLQLANETLDRLASRDSLTGLSNRKSFLEELELRLQQAEHPSVLSVLFVDLDGLKRINDTFGHEAGDQLLRIVADRLRRAVDSDDVVARLGGDEFTLIVEHQVGEDSAAKVATRAIEAIAAPCQMFGHEIAVSASVGIASMPDHGTTADALMRHSDSAMYVAKASGRNRFARFGSRPETLKVHDGHAEGPLPA